MVNFLLKFNIRVVFKSGQTLRSMLTKVKDTLPLGKQSNVVYRIPCSCGQVYIGETKRRLETRLKEHRDACERGMMEKSAVAEHAWENHHPIDWEETTVLDRGRGQELLLKEALHISQCLGQAGPTYIKVHWYDLNHQLHLQINTLVLVTIIT